MSFSRFSPFRKSVTVCKVSSASSGVTAPRLVNMLCMSGTPLSTSCCTIKKGDCPLSSSLFLKEFLDKAAF